MGCQQSKAAEEISTNVDEERQETAKGSNATVVKNGASKAIDPVAANVPRHAWIIIWIDDKKVGKIVMALKGKGVAKAVSDFESIYAGAVLDPNNLCIQETDPKFYIVMQGSKGLEGKADIYGVVQEGSEVINSIRTAEEDAMIFVKQAHLYPVKIAK